MPIPPVVQELIARFQRNHDTYMDAEQYNESRLRIEFLDPLFEALGWDMANKGGYADAYKDVIHEDVLKIGGGTKAPDYCFRIGGSRKFFLEAKKPSVHIKGDPSPAYQLRRYAWSAKLPISVLSDFEEFAIYDTRVKPSMNDKAATARVFYCTYEQLPEKWDEISAIFSKEAVLKGSFDKFADTAARKRGTAEVDAAFLTEIEAWRDSLAQNIALRNLDISERDLNYAVTKTIDRVVFLRICEDRGIEPYAQLQTIAKVDDVYGELLKLFRRADEKYNSGLFHFAQESGRDDEPDILTPALEIDDKVLRPILASLYYPDCPYEFSVLPADILGHVYEQFLGKVIRLTTGHRAKVEEKPEVRKAGGVYYTPTYVVDYIVQNTVGKQVEGKTPKEVAKLTILDPACGSGSFLLGAYQYLLDWHLRFYANNNPAALAKQKNPPIYQGAKKEDSDAQGFRLTLAERKRILLANIYGVDIDPNAVETTKLSLLLKALEGESAETLQNQMKLFRERALPDLASNIKCGNSLIGEDFYVNRQLALIDDVTLQKINVFDWAAAFKTIMGTGGFDLVIGNPPYVRQELLTEVKGYFQSHYKVYHGVADLYSYFVERALGVIRPGGELGMIVSNKWLRAAYGEPLRGFLQNTVTIKHILDLAGLPVFKGATVRTLILLCAKLNPTNNQITYTKPLDVGLFRSSVSAQILSEHVRNTASAVPQNTLSHKGWSFSGADSYRLNEKIRSKSVSLSDYVGDALFRGVVTGLNDAFVISAETRRALIKANKSAVSAIKPVLFGKDVRRYQIEDHSRFLIFTRRGVDIEKYPSLRDHLAQYRRDLTPRKNASDPYGRKPGKYKWYEIQDSVEYYKKFDQPKIICPDISTSVRFYLDKEGFYGSNTTYCIGVEDLYLLGILNSKIAQFSFRQICAGLEGGDEIYLRFFGQYLEQFPVYRINQKVRSDRTRHEAIILQVKNMIYLQELLVKTKSGRETIQRQIDATDRQIDHLVYQLYELTPEEIALVEQETAK